MKKYLTLTVLSVTSIASFSSQSFAKDGYFAVANTGYAPVSLYDTETDFHTQVYGIGAGYNKNNWSFSITADHRILSSDEGMSSLNAKTFLANAVYNFKPIVGKANLYLGGGYGVARVSFANASSTDEAIQLQFGAKMPVRKNLEAFADLRATATTSEMTKASDVSFFSPSINIGGKYNF